MDICCVFFWFDFLCFNNFDRMTSPLFGVLGILLLAVGSKKSDFFYILDGKRKIEMKIYVGNLAYRTTDDEIRQEFEKYGSVNQVDIITDRETGRSKGFGFVEMPDDEEANKAIEALDGFSIGERTLKVNEALPKAPRSGGYGGGGGGRSRGHRDRGDREKRY
jgi:RNA recognition motif-containing protein